MLRGKANESQALRDKSLLLKNEPQPVKTKSCTLRTESKMLRNKSVKSKIDIIIDSSQKLREESENTRN